METHSQSNNQRRLLIKLDGITFRYPGSTANIIDKLDLKLYRNDRIGLMAPNGSGKTTLFYLIMGLLKPAAGQIHIFGKPVSSENDFKLIRRRIGLLFQDADDQLFSPTVLEDVAFGPLNQGKTPAQAKKISIETLTTLGLNNFENRITHKLSGGEKKLVSLATVLAMKPEILLLDEPSTGLDKATKALLINLIAKLDISYILISHDHHFLNKLSKSIYSMENGKISTELILHRHFHNHPKNSFYMH